MPINKNVHWYLAIICYPNLIEPVFSPPGDDPNKNKSINDDSIRKKKTDDESRKSKLPKKFSLADLDSSGSSSDNMSSADDDSYETKILNKMNHIKNCVKM